MKNLTLTSLFLFLCTQLLSQCNFGIDSPLPSSSIHVRDYLLGTPIEISYTANISHLGMISMGENDNFKVAVYDDNDGMPGNLLTSGEGITEIGEVIVDVPDIVVSPGTYYFFAVFDSNTSISCDTVATETMWYMPLSHDQGLPSELNNLNAYTEKRFSYFFVCEPNVSLYSVNTTIYASEQNADGYQWIDCNTGVTVQGATGSSYTGNLYESYYCVVTQNGCSRISECFTIGVTDLEEPDWVESLTVGPNPSNGFVSVQLPFSLNPYEIMIYDLNGRLIFNDTTEGNKSYSIDQQLSEGMYQFYIVSGEHQTTERIVVY